MVWLFACFGYSKKRKRLKSFHRIHSQDKGIGSYQPIESPSSRLPQVSDGGKANVIHSNLKRRKQDKARIRKKVRFDLNVIAYEPIPANSDNDDDNDNDLRSLFAAQWEEQEGLESEEEEDSVDLLICRGLSTRVKRDRSNTSDYRYNNCYDDEDTGSEIDDGLGMEELEDDEERAKEELETAHESLESDSSRSRCANPVLIPIENLSQWRAIKMKRWEIVA